MDSPRKELPDDIEISEGNFLSREMLEKKYAVVSQEGELEKLEELYDDPETIDSLSVETEYDALIDVGLAVKNTGFEDEDPYVRITNLGRAFVECDTVEDALEFLAKT